VRRLREEVGWTPRWGLRAGLEDAVEWWRSRMAAHPD
jgi:nucleoside-diphosphate-sugar epimerase